MASEGSKHLRQQATKHLLKGSYAMPECAYNAEVATANVLGLRGKAHLMPYSVAMPGLSSVFSFNCMNTPLPLVTISRR